MAASNFSVTIVYESIEAGHRARRFSDYLIAAAEIDGGIDLNLWNFGVLGIPGVRNAAASAAAISDVVILSMSGTIPLPSHTVKWIEMWAWLIDRRKPALVALFGTRHPENAAIRTYLRGSTTGKKLEFFPVVFGTPSEMTPEPDFCNRQQPALGVGASDHRNCCPPHLIAKAQSPPKGTGKFQSKRPLRCGSKEGNQGR